MLTIYEKAFFERLEYERMLLAEACQALLEVLIKMVESAVHYF